MVDDKRYGGKDYVPVSLRLAWDEKAYLVEQAGNMPLSAYMRAKLLDNPRPRKKQRKRNQKPVKDHKALAQVLGMLGNRKYANNLNQIAKAINTGSLIVSPEMEEAIRSACRHVFLIRYKLVQALGLKSEDDAGDV